MDELLSTSSKIPLLLLFFKRPRRDFSSVRNLAMPMQSTATLTVRDTRSTTDMEESNNRDMIKMLTTMKMPMGEPMRAIVSVWRTCNEEAETR